MKKIKKEKNLNPSPLLKELTNKPDSYLDVSFEKEEKQRAYQSCIKIIDSVSNEAIQMYYDLEKKYKERSQEIRQKTFTLEKLARERGLIPVFITFTLPSQFHPVICKENKQFERVYLKDNPSFIFKNIDESIEKGYKELNRIHKLFYKRVKFLSEGRCYFIKVVEPHKTFIPHLHCIFYIPRECVEKVYNSFLRIQKKYKLGHADMEISQFKDDVTHASSYLLKYVSKNLNDSNDIYQMRLLDGWKRKYKIREFSCSQLPINSNIFKKLYKSSTKRRKNKINSKKEYKIHNVREIVRNCVHDKNISFYYYFLKNVYVEKHMIDDKGQFIKNSTYGCISSPFKVTEEIERYTSRGRYAYKTLGLKITYRGVVIYDKNQFISLKGGNHHE